ncbi:NAD-glutamate dehydrogenase [Echinimonas agarilytica]|uniref:NAD-glutamate dehydrogenase n=1 Tax=Echinimonas agarilytica TaxID=1215918 RepID=A0AA42B9K0_9GAMM|nr:NAD-glutamate dehydrogenase [Echinimonas agarilytica]MCM2681161.1 NAD-glutamate dehydrogenase [Echinimonas agarilytica]
MPNTGSQNTPVLLDRVFDLICQNVKSGPDSVRNLAQLIYGRVSLEDLSKRSDSDLYGALLSLWNLANDYDGEKAHIRILNPELEQHGWHSNHTVIEIVTQDMPFLVDSVRMALTRLGITCHLLLHSPVLVSRDDSGKVTGIEENVDASQSELETLFHIEIDRQSSTESRDAVLTELESVLLDVAASVNDWKPMLGQLESVIQEVRNTDYPDSGLPKEEVLRYLQWVSEGNCTLMGYHQTDIVPIAGDYEVRVIAGTELGILKLNPVNPVIRLSDMISSGQEAAVSPEVLILTKTNQKSRVHRNAFPDYIGIKRFDAQGKVIGEHRFIGLYSSALYNNSAQHVPLLKTKLDQVMGMSGLIKGSHAYKALLNIIETYPRDELIQATQQELLEVGVGVLQMQERDMTRLFVRRELFGRFYSCMVYVTKERYNTQLRRHTQAILQASFGSRSTVEFTTFFSESELARTHYIVHVDNNQQDVDVNEIQNNLIEAARSWDDRFGEALTRKFGDNHGRQLAVKYENGFAPSYKERTLPNSALVDIDKIEQLNDADHLGMLFYQPQEDKGTDRVCLKLFHRDQPIPLSDVLPVLENLGLKVIGERPYEVRDTDGNVSWILEFNMLHLGNESLDLAQCQERFQQALGGVWSGDYENDSFNRLVLGAKLTARQVSILRAYAKYMRQLGVSFSQQYIEDALNRYPAVAALLVKAFDQRFNIEHKQADRDSNHEACVAEVESLLDEVSNLDEDRIIRRYMALISATVRTNAYQTIEQGEHKPYVSFKMLPHLIPDVPLPLPEFEIFVYSPRVEGVHLRGGKVARGGLRWSDRREDFRTEVLGLVKAQQVKNTVIVPVGAKGGFVCKQQKTGASRDEFIAEGQACYRIFIRGLLDITDNMVKGQLVPPQSVVRHDEDDSYLVVAADKGTATFSDIANEIAEEYGFWLGDAFASGGSQGYDHKKMGITAKGAWESVKRHFREMDIDCQNTEFTAIGIGDMAGDVFGNGMLLSKHTKILAAFNHLHIFIDPNPDASASFAERERLFNLPRSNWTDYDYSLISEGGGIYERSAKSITVSEQAKLALGLASTTFTPNDLLQQILKAPVDLIWNGGIGTYFKAASESHSDVGDRANDAVRINGTEMRAKVLGEGGNLGATQLGRIEFARNGGRVNTDFIDNVGGVDCSDNEVNIKILLTLVEQAGEMTRKQRNKLLVEMTDEVSEMVLDDCYLQTQSISVTQSRGAALLKEQIRLIQDLERRGILDRSLEFLPSDEELSQRQAMSEGLTRPELSVLISYDKMVLKEALNNDVITSDSFHASTMAKAFPKYLQNTYHKQMLDHPLRSEIISTQIANQIVNDMGLNFVNRMKDETGAEINEIASSYTLAREVFKATEIREQLQSRDNLVPASTQLECMIEIRRILRHATRWFVRHRNRAMSINDSVMFYLPAFESVLNHLETSLVPAEWQVLQQQSKDYQEKGLPASLAEKMATLSTLFSTLDIAQIAQLQNRPIELVSEIYFKLGAQLELHWFLEQISEQPVANHWQALARASFREELDWQQRALTLAVDRYCQDGCEAQSMVDRWFEEHRASISRWIQMLNEFKTVRGHEYAKFSVALRELMLLSHTSDPLQ